MRALKRRQPALAHAHTSHTRTIIHILTRAHSYPHPRSLSPSPTILFPTVLHIQARTSHEYFDGVHALNRDYHTMIVECGYLLGSQPVTLTR